MILNFFAQVQSGTLNISKYTEKKTHSRKEKIGI